MTKRITISGDFQAGFDRPKGNFGKEKNQRINEAIQNFYNRVREAAPVAWAQSDVPEDTGKLSKEAFGIGTVKKSRGPGGTSYSLNMGVTRVDTTPPLWRGPAKGGESYYPKFVQEGTEGPITPKKKSGKGSIMPIKAKGSGRAIVKGYSRAVPGQEANPYMDRFARRMNAAITAPRKKLGREIKRIIEE